MKHIPLRLRLFSRGPILPLSAILWLQKYRKGIIQGLFLLFLIGTTIYFIQTEREEVAAIAGHLAQADWTWVLIGIAVTALYIVLQGSMYVYSFAAIGQSIGLKEGIRLFVRRFGLSVLLPAGGVTSLAFFTGDFEKRGISKQEIHIASSLYAFVGFVSLLLVAIPVGLWALLTKGLHGDEMLGFAALTLISGLLGWAGWSAAHGGWIFRLLERYAADMAEVLVGLRARGFQWRAFSRINMASLGVEITGILHLYIAMRALGVAEASMTAAVMGYTLCTVVMSVSPFLRGLGAVELTLAVVLHQYGMVYTDAIAVTMLFRFFEFWTPLLASAGSVGLQRDQLLWRMLPAPLLMAVGLLNIASAMTPGLVHRVRLLDEFLPDSVLAASNMLVLMSGVVMLFLSVYLFKGYRFAWLGALALSTVSVLGHLTKALDYEEALVAALLIAVLCWTRRDYFKKAQPGWRWFGLRTAVLVLAGVFTYGFIGFYFLDIKHFGVDLTTAQSIRGTLEKMLFLDLSDLHPRTVYGKFFLLSIELASATMWVFVAYGFVRPYLMSPQENGDNRQIALDMVHRFGSSSLDYFKTYFDKQFYFAPDGNGFVAYRIANGFAMVLEKPVAPDEAGQRQLLQQFEDYCRGRSLKTAYYRVSACDLPLFQSFGKKSLFIGQVGIADLSTFSLEGKERKALRNTISSIERKGYRAHIYTAPLSGGLVQKLKAVSDEWLVEQDWEEMVFSQGIFSAQEIKNQTVITLEDEEGKVMAFLNIIPDFTPGEGSYDLIRKTADAPGGAMDYLMMEAFGYFTRLGLRFVDLGMAPLSGLDETHNLPEKGIKLAYERLRALAHYRGLRQFKEKYATTWENKYLVYGAAYDLLELPKALGKVVRLDKAIAG